MDVADAAPPSGAYLIINGRKWRRSDPAIPEPLRQEIVRELMSARRAVGAAGHVNAEKAARARVHDAKLALGERGRAWWLPPTTVDRHRRIDATIRALLRSRREDASICPSDVARAVGGTSWRPLMVDVRERATALAKSGEIGIWRRGHIVTDEPTSGVLRYRLIRQALRPGIVSVRETDAATDHRDVAGADDRRGDPPGDAPRHDPTNTTVVIPS